MLRLLLLRRRPSPQEVRDQPELPRCLIGTILQEFDTVADDHWVKHGDGKIHGSANDYSASAARRPCHRDENPLEQLSACVNREHSARSSTGCWRKIRS